MNRQAPALRNIRYDALVATFVAVCAVCVSAYTARVQRQQVRAMVWPILEYSTSNEPTINLALANKGVGPAIVRRVTVKVDGQPVHDWREAAQKLLGSGTHHYACSNLRGLVLSPGESVNFFVPYGDDDKPLTYPASDGSLGKQWNEARFRVSVEVYFGSTLGDNWMLRSGRDGDDKQRRFRRYPPPLPRISGSN